MHTAAEAAEALAANPMPQFTEVTIWSRSMLTAQAATLGTSARAALTERADWIRLITGTTDRQTLAVEVRNPDHPAEPVGHVHFGNL